ncbi:hypothetical protein AFLA_013141 [Aspergillus flavus NRRL3357]|nr:hypothetical protein AFLA_013141 [Aspergillus flavus NRRL3357]
MSVEPRITSANPVRQQGHLDYERCAALNNEIYRLSWSGYYSGSHITWWEYFSPSLKTAETLDPSLIKFLKLALFDPKDGPSDWTDRPALFYWISSLNDPDAFFETWVKELYPGRFVWLYCATGYLMGDERGILYDQEESLAAFVGYKFEERPMCIHGWGFKPLEVILDSYLDMIDEEKALSAMQRLLEAIEARQPSREAADSYNPWSDPSLLASINLPPNTFAHDFLMGLSTQKIHFRYIAPGIRLPTVAEFANQPYLGSYPTNDPTSLPLLLFYTDGEKGLGHGLHPLSPPPPLSTSQPRSDTPEIPARMVEAGEWKIGDDGVIDKIQRFKDADTEMHWYKYCIPPSW